MIGIPVAIVGAGIGGLTAALCLAQRGFKVTVYEQASALSEIGAGVHLSPNGMKVMRALGLENALEEVAAHPRAISTRDYASGEPNFEGPLDEAFRERFGAAFYSFHRADLHAVRESLFGALGTKFTGHVAYRGLVERSELAEGLVEDKLNIWVGPGKHVVAYPVRRGELINYVALVEEDGWDDESWTTLADANTLQATFAGWNDTVRTLVGRTLRGQCYKWALLGRDPMPSWSRGNTTLLGDAAHPMVPYLAQGAVMAIEDAWAVAGCLAGADDCAAAFQRYEDERIQRTTAIQAAAWEQGRLNHAVGREGDDETFRGGGFAEPAWIYGYDVVDLFPI